MIYAMLGILLTVILSLCILIDKAEQDSKVNHRG